MLRKKVFVSFDYENDRHYKRLLQAWNANSKFDFIFDDRSSGEIQTASVARVKAALTAKIKQATHTLVIVGAEANRLHRDYREIGYTNWINFEVARSKDCGNRLVAVKLDRTFQSPDELKNSNATWAMSFNETAIVKALNEASMYRYAI